MTPKTTQELLPPPITESWARTEFKVVRRPRPHRDWLPLRGSDGSVSWWPRAFAHWLAAAPTWLPREVSR
jgi:hypothetical protein